MPSGLLANLLLAHQLHLSLQPNKAHHPLGTVLLRYRQRLYALTPSPSQALTPKLSTPFQSSKLLNTILAMLYLSYPRRIHKLILINHYPLTLLL